jgi:sugar transferase (PEP-CTERM system associated)
MVRLFSHYFPLSTLLIVVLDAAALLAAQMAGLMSVQGAGIPNLMDFVPGAMAIAFVMIAFSGTLGIYGNASFDDFWSSARRLFLPLVIALPILQWIVWRGMDGSISVRAMAIALVVACVARLLVFRVGTASTSLINRRIMIVGVGTDAALVKETLEQSRVPGLFLVGFYSPDAEPKAVATLPANKILLPTTSILDTARQLNVTEIVLAVRERRGSVVPLNELLTCKLNGIKVTDLSGFFETYKSKVKIDLLRESWFIFGDGFRQNRWRMFVKRTFDILASGLLLFLSFPVMLLTAIAIKLESKGPVIYRQQRVGLGGKGFDVLKFRSMRTDAEVDGKPQWAKPGDSRVTRVGRFIRLTRIDELPQLLTVLKGEMSLVGPRPERPFFVDQITKQVPFYAARHSVKPGVTGWAQVRHHYGSSIDDASDKLEYDLFYVKNHTLFFDILVLFYSVKVVLTAQGSR